MSARSGSPGVGQKLKSLAEVKGMGREVNEGVGSDEGGKAAGVEGGYGWGEGRVD